MVFRKFVLRYYCVDCGTYSKDGKPISPDNCPFCKEMTA